MAQHSPRLPHSPMFYGADEMEWPRDPTNLPSNFDKNWRAMMGGFGSGGWNATGRSTVGQHVALEIGHLRRNRLLGEGVVGQLHWCRANDEPAAVIEVIGGRERIRLRYRARRAEEPWQLFDEPVGVTWQACRFGGERPFFNCSGCARPVLKLHLVGMRFRCRRCHGLSYGSQRERGPDRALRRANALRRRLGGAPGMANPLPSRPLFMRAATYDAWITDIRRQELAACDHAAAVLLRMTRPRAGRIGGFWR